MIRLGSLAGYPFEGPRLLAGWTPAAVPAVYAITCKPDPAREQHAVIYVAIAPTWRRSDSRSGTRRHRPGSSARIEVPAVCVRLSRCPAVQRGAVSRSPAS